MYGVQLSDTEIKQRLVRLRNLERLHEEDQKAKAELRLANKQLQDQLSVALSQITDLTAQVKALQDEVQRLKDGSTKYKFYLFKDQKQAKNIGKRHPPLRAASSYVRPQPTEAEITDRQEVCLSSCPHCQGPVSASVETFEAYVEDIVFRPKAVTKYTVHRHWCNQCHKLVRAPLPNALPGMSLGLNTVLYVLVEHYRAKKTDEQIVESLRRYFSLTVSLGEISEIRHLAARYFKDQFNAVVRTIREAAVIYADETGWYVQGHKHGQCWHIAAPEVPAVLFKLADSRAKDELQSILGPNFTVSDFYSVYDGVGSEQQKCWVHLLRDSRLLTRASPENKERAQLHGALTTCYRVIAAFRRKRWYHWRARLVEHKLDTRLLQLAAKQWQDRECVRLAKRIAKYHHELLTCVRIPGVLPENNTAERGLRPVVVQRKITSGNRSSKGANTYEVNMSVIATMQAEGGDLLEKLRTTLWLAAWSQKFGVPATSLG